MATLQDQLDFLKTASSQGAEAALQNHGNDLTSAEADGFRALDGDQLDQLYVINKKIADVRNAEGNGPEPESTNNLC